MGEDCLIRDLREARAERDALAALLLEARDVLWHQPSSVSHDPNNCVGCRTEAAIDAALAKEKT